MLKSWQLVEEVKFYIEKMGLNYSFYLRPPIYPHIPNIVF